MSDPYETLKEAERSRMAAENAFNAAKKHVEAIEVAFREALRVGRNVPCSVAILPNGKVVVHVWVESSSQMNQLHIVSPSYLTEDAKPREKFPNEQLGGL